MSKKINWLDNCVIRSNYSISLCTTKKLYNQIIKSGKIERPFDWPESGAALHTFCCNRGQQLHVVCINAAFERTENEAKALLVHEATHMAQSIFEDMAEKKASPEFEAYAIQRLSLVLFDEYDRQTKKKKACTTKSK